MSLAVNLLRLGLSGTALVTVALSLSACETSLYDGPMALTMQKGAAIVAVCVDIEAVTMLGTERSTGSNKWNEFLDADGQLAISSGDTIPVSGDVDGLMAHYYREPSFDPGSEIEIVLLAREVEGYNGDISASFIIQEGGLSEKSWLYPDGSEHQQPCESEG